MIKIGDIPKNHIRTNSGTYVNVFKPKPDMFLIEDMANALSQLPRFGGHLDRFYSVAQHSVICMRKATLHNKMGALLHDGSEAYLLDMPTPIKRNLPDYSAVEEKVMKTIAKKFEFDFPLNPEIKKIDRKVLDIEWNNLVAANNPEFICWTPARSKKEFLKAYYQLVDELSIMYV